LTEYIHVLFVTKT